VLHRHLLPVLSILAQTLQSLIHVSGCSSVLSGVWIIFGVFFWVSDWIGLRHPMDGSTRSLFQLLLFKGS
jgi:hypothetical protein